MKSFEKAAYNLTDCSTYLTNTLTITNLTIMNTSTNAIAEW